MAGFVLVPALARLTESSGVALGLWRFLLISIALFAFAYGLRGGAAAGVAAVVLSVGWYASGHPDGATSAVVVLRSSNYVLAGLILGWLVESRARAVGALARHVELSSDVIVSGEAGQLDSVNPTFARVLGYAAEEVVGTSYLELVHADDRLRCIAVETEIASGAGPVGPVEVRFRHRDGSYRWLEWSITLDPGSGTAIRFSDHSRPRMSAA